MWAMPLFLFPCLAGTVKNGASTVLIIMVVLGLFQLQKLPAIMAPSDKKIFWGYLLFVLLACLSFINIDDFSEGLKRLERLARFLMAIPLYLYIKQLKVESGKVFLWGVVAASIIMGGMAVQQINCLAVERVSLAYSPILTGQVAMLFSLVLFVSLFTVYSNVLLRLLFFVSSVLLLMVTVSSGTRGVWLAALVFLAIAAHWMLNKKTTQQSWLFIVSVLVLLFVGTWLFRPAIIDSRLKSVQQNIITYQNGTNLFTPVGYRLVMWKNSLLMWAEHPLVGTGLGDHAFETKKLVAQGDSVDVFIDFSHSHNIYFDALGGTGLIGLFSLLSLVFFLPFKKFYRNLKILGYSSWPGFYAIMGLGTIATFMVYGLTESWLCRSPAITTYIVTVTLCQASLNSSDFGCNRKGDL